MKKIMTIFIIPLLFMTACDLMEAENEYLEDPPLLVNFMSFPAASPSGMKTIMSDGKERTYYLKLPQGYNEAHTYPLIIALHGTGGNSSKYLENTYYNLQGAVGNEAILVYPNASPSAVPQWNYKNDIPFFDDIIADLKATLSFDEKRLFVVGHSSGAGFAHQLGCDRGDVIRAIAPVAGGLLDDSNCTGEVAVIQIQGSKDTMVPPSAAEPGRDFWATYNGCNREKTENVSPPPCTAYADCDAHFPVQYCEHDEYDPDRNGGHAWPTFGGTAIWRFFRSLSPLEPSSQQGSGAEEATLSGITNSASFTLRFPADFSPPPVSIALALDYAGTRQPLTDMPQHMLTTTEIPVTTYQIGGETSYRIESVNLTNVEIPGDYTFLVVVYVEGSSWPVPSGGKDYVGIADITLEGYDPIVISDPIDLEVLEFDI